MAADSQNPFGQKPGKIETRVERFQTLSGQVVEIRWTQQYVLENNVLRKVMVFEIDPPLADARTPKSVEDIRECCVCCGTYHKDNVLRCPICGMDFCSRCKGSIKRDGTEIEACATCAKWENAGFIGKMWMRLWALGS